RAARVARPATRRDVTRDRQRDPTPDRDGRRERHAVGGAAHADRPARHLLLGRRAPRPVGPTQTATPGGSMTEEGLLTLEEIDRRHILHVVEMCGGNRTNAAQVLHIDRKTLYRKLLRWGV